MFAKLGHAVAHHPWWVIAAWVVAAAAIVAFAPALEVNSDQTSFLPAEAPTGSTPPSSTSTALT